MSVTRVSLRDIARQVGVTAATVSLALRNSAEISAERRRQIKKIAAELGYRPDPALTALAEYRRGRRRPEYREQLAFLYQSAYGESFERWSDFPIRRDLVAGLRKRADELGYGVEVHDLGVDENCQKKVARMCRNRGIRGVLIHANLQPPEQVFRHFRAFAALNVIQFSEKPFFHSVRSNDYEAMRMALMNLFALGYRNPLYVRTDPKHGLFGPETMGGFDWFQTEHQGQGICCRHVFFNDFIRRAPEILAGPPPVDVVLTHDHRPMSALLERLNVRVPAQCGICFLFTSPESASFGGIDVQGRLLGQRAAETIDLMLRHNDIGPIDGPSTLLVPPKWQPGPSLTQRRIRKTNKPAPRVF